jgi:MFS superfamily sulfate permease-like transporter
MSNASTTEPGIANAAGEVLPKDRLTGLKENWKADMVSGFILFLIALPLSLAIAIASGAPPMAGLFSAIIGGIVVSQLSGSYVTINGPAAGLIVVIIGAVDRLGGGSAGYHCACASVVVAGVALFIAGLCKAGTLAIKLSMLKKIPAPIIVVTVGVLMGVLFHVGTKQTYIFNGHEYLIAPKKMLVVLPNSFMDAVTAPDWSKFASSAFWYSVVAITLVQGVETLLSCAAVDKLDPCKRTSDLSRDIAAVGIGTVISGMIGGIPMIAEIVRSTANVSNGAKTRWSNFFHGVFILVFVLLGSALIDMIPQACLAALLIMVGFRLASPREFIHTYEIGPEQLVLYVTTIVAVLATDLLVGVGVGIALKVLLHLVNGAPVGPNLFMAESSVEHEGDAYTVNVKGVAVFSNFLSLKYQLDKVPSGKKLYVNLSNVRFIDHSSMDHLSQFKRNYDKTGGQMELTGLSEHKPSSNHALSSRKLMKIAS